MKYIPLVFILLMFLLQLQLSDIHVEVSMSTDNEVEAGTDYGRGRFFNERIVSSYKKLSVWELDYNEDILWLARAIYTETKRPEEMELVAWVIRNRVETKHRGKSTYKDVVLDPFQFSAFNFRKNRVKYSKYDQYNIPNKHFENALKIAWLVYHAPESMRPFPKETLYFYSPIGMKHRLKPRWANIYKHVPITDRVINDKRFKFYKPN